MTEQTFQEPLVNGKPVTFLVDTGATLSLLNFDVPEKSLETVMIKGVSGMEEKVLTKPLPILLFNRLTWVQFVISPTSPISLLGRDVLRELGTKLDLNSKTTKLYFWGNVFAVEKEPKQKQEIPVELKEIPKEFWSRNSQGVGFLKSAKPVEIKTKEGPPPSVKQYPVVTEALPSLRKQIQKFVDEEILRPVVSPYNTPILPVNKNRLDANGDPEYWFVQDLRAINEYVEAPHPVVPDLPLILTEIPAWSRWYTVLDLTGAFFSIPIAQNSQAIFAFTWEGKQFTWTRLPQGFTSSPTLFSQILKNDLKDVELPEKSTLIKYVDDLLIASVTREACVKDTQYLCQKLYEKGHKVSLSKLQFCKTEVKYLGFILSLGERKLDPDRVAAIQEIARPVTKKQMRAFLGQAGFCQPWILGYSELIKPLTETTREQAVEPIPWTDKLQTAFLSEKQALMSAPALGLPDYSKPFHLYVTEMSGHAKGVLTQKLGP
uniref:ribonuclease H n=1 Tax=Phasianus colchicus TaxID=9054 RepID=A0A669QQR7_PHACC